MKELDGVVTHGKSEAEALKMAHEAIKLHLESLKAHKEPIPEPIALKKISGQLPLRMGPIRHKNALMQAAQRGFKSLNEYICILIDEQEKSPRSKSYIRSPSVKYQTKTQKNVPAKKTKTKL